MEFNNQSQNDTFDEDCQPVQPNSTLASVYFQSAVYSMYAVIFVVAVIGNSFVCYMVLSSPRMRTVTNYFILNLAIGDMLITILCVPFTSVGMLKQYWPFGSVLCPLVNYSQALAVFVSAYTLVAISIDRYMIIMWPMKPRISKGFATSIIGLVWLIAGITVLPSGAFATLAYEKDILGTDLYEKCDLYICQEDYSKVGEEYGSMYTTILLFLQYIIPLVVLLFTYTSIGVVIWCHRIPGEAENSRDQRIAKSKTKIDAKSGESDTFLHLLTKCKRVSMNLLLNGITKDDIICQCSWNHVNSCVPIIAGFFLGVQVATIEPDLPYEFITGILSVLRPRIIFVSFDMAKDIDDILDDLDIPCWVILFGKSEFFVEFKSWLAPVEDEDSFKPLPIENLNETAVILFSGGSKESPKGVCLSHYTLLMQTYNSIKAWNLEKKIDLSGSEEERKNNGNFNVVMSFNSFYWISEILILTACTLTGSKRIIASFERTDQIWKNLDIYKVRFMICTTSQAVEISRNGKPEAVQGDSLKMLVTTGTSMTRPILKELRPLFPFCFITNCYMELEFGGPVGMFSFNKPEDIRDQYEKATSSGKIVPGFSLMMIKMMVIVVCGYTICWLPYNVLLIVQQHISPGVMTFLYFPLHGLAMSHACYNPIIYCYMNGRFRDGLVQVLRSIPCIRRCIAPLLHSSRFPHTGMEGSTESTFLQRTNTCTTYVSMKRKNCHRTSTCNHQLPVRSASLMRNSNSTQHNGVRRIRYTPQNVMDEQM